MNSTRPWTWGAPWWSRYTPAPPAWPPGLGREHYLPEQFHFVDQVDVPLNLAARVTARTAARWADRYEAYLLNSSSDQRRQGPLPTDLGAREEQIDQLFDWIEGLIVEYQASVNLYRGEQRLLDQSEGIPGVLALTPDEFVQLQEAWERHGLPRDLYYPAREQQTIIEPTRMHGGVVQVERRYSPLRWAHRDKAAMVPLQVPSEEERAQIFDEARSRFLDALRLRGAELSQPGRAAATKPDKIGRWLVRDVALVAPGVPRREMPTSNESDRPQNSPPASRGYYPAPGPPGGVPGPGRQWYLPERFYFAGPASVPLGDASRVTVQCVARWADRYTAYSTIAKDMPDDAQRRGGQLPLDSEARTALVNEIFAWFEQHGVPWYVAAVNLDLGDQPLLDAHDDIPGVLALMPEQFVELQRTWEQHGLPHDLYYLAREQRTVIEPTILLDGGVARTYQRYTPLEWAHRDQRAIASRRIPSEEESATAFAEACDQFAEALRLRAAELSEPGKEPDRDMLWRMSRLVRKVNRVACRARDSQLLTEDAADTPSEDHAPGR